MSASGDESISTIISKSLTHYEDIPSFSDSDDYDDDGVESFFKYEILEVSF